jgi:hypothetical protein
VRAVHFGATIGGADHFFQLIVFFHRISLFTSRAVSACCAPAARRCRLLLAAAATAAEFAPLPATSGWSSSSSRTGRVFHCFQQPIQNFVLRFCELFRTESGREVLLDDFTEFIEYSIK